MTATETLVATVSTAMKERLAIEAVRRRVPMTVIVREAIDAYLKPAPAKTPVSAPPASVDSPPARALPEPGTSRWLTPHDEVDE